MIVLAALLQKLVRFDAVKFASISAYAVPAMSMALLVDQSHRQPLIDALSLSTAASFALNACHAALPPSFFDKISRIPKLVHQRLSASEIGESIESDESNAALFFLIVVSIIALFLLARVLLAVLKTSIRSLDSMTLLAIFVSQLSALFILPRVPNLRSALGCVLCVTQLLTAPYLRNRSLPLPTEKNRRLFIVCVIPIAMAFSSRGVELSVLLQTVLDARALFRAAVKRPQSSDPHLTQYDASSSNNSIFRLLSFLLTIFVLIFLCLDIFQFLATSYVVELVKSSYKQTIQLDLTFISIFVLSWGANYDAGFPSLLVVTVTLLLPSLKG
jgi:hypothetical protein